MATLEFCFRLRTTFLWSSTSPLCQFESVIITKSGSKSGLRAFKNFSKRTDFTLTSFWHLGILILKMPMINSISLIPNFIYDLVTGKIDFTKPFDTWGRVSAWSFYEKKIQDLLQRGVWKTCTITSYSSNNGDFQTIILKLFQKKNDGSCLQFQLSFVRP